MTHEATGMPFVEVSVQGRPATYATAGEKAWKEAVAAAFETAQVPTAPPGRLHLTIHFRLPVPRHAGEFWDIDNLVKPTMDAMGAVLGYRAWRGKSQAQDDRVDSLLATKQMANDGQSIGAWIEVRLLG